MHSDGMRPIFAVVFLFDNFRRLFFFILLDFDFVIVNNLLILGSGFAGLGFLIMGRIVFFYFFVFFFFFFFGPTAALTKEIKASHSS